MDNTMVTIPVGFMLITKEEYDKLHNEIVELNERYNTIKDYVASERYISDKTLKGMFGLLEEEEGE